ncbi:MAG: ribosome maturation factor RimM [Bacilli bacterium]
MEYIYIGDIVNTHGLKGELRIISDFKYKNEVFKPGFNIYVGRQKEKLEIKTYRQHKNYDMVTLVDVNGIEEAIAYKGDSVYINRQSLTIDGYFDEDLIGLKAYTDDNFIGEVNDLLKNKANDILVIINGDKKYLVPNIPEFISNVDLSKSRVDINNIKGLFDEN